MFASFGLETFIVCQPVCHMASTYLRSNRAYLHFIDLACECCTGP